MTTNYNVTGAERKALVQAIGTYLGEKPKYLGVPSCAYQIGDFTVTKDGALEFSDRTDSEVVEGLYEAIAAAGFDFEEPAAEPEAVSLTVSLPAERHTGTTLRNLVNLIYTRASLLNKALGTAFRVDEGLTDALQDEAAVLTAESFRAAVAAYEDEHGKAIDGLTVTPETITFSTLPETDDPAVVKTFTELCALMNRQALDQKRIQAKAVNEENEKYALRIWLLRLGMNGPDHKEERRILMANLSGHCAFRTPAEEAKWKARQAEKRDALRAAKAETLAEEVTDDEVSE